MLAILKLSYMAIKGKYAIQITRHKGKHGIMPGI
jgi:hypothetical protein